MTRDQVSVAAVWTLLLGSGAAIAISLGSVTHAQTATPLSRFAWEEAGPDLATVSAYVYRVYATGQLVGTPLANVVCVERGPVAVFTCEAPVGPFAPGSHTVTLTAGDASGVSEMSAPVTFVMVIVPAVPAGVRVR